MTKARMETFSDGVIAILITIMVLGLEAPTGTGWADLRPMMPGVLTYLLSFVFLAIYWNNHHHMLHLTDRINGTILWANMHLLFWLSLVPVVTAWLGRSGAATVPAAVYGLVLLMAALAYYVLQSAIIALQGPGSRLQAAVGADLKGKISPVLYVAAIALAFADRWIAIGLYVFVALMWIVPDRRIEMRVTAEGG
jgi:uncharacterized membrane protein